MQTPNMTLTEIETLGLQSQFNFADGHAYHDLGPSQRQLIENLGSIWEHSSQKKVKESEWDYKDAFWRLAESPSLKAYKYFKICPTASNSIDMVAAVLADKKLSTALLEPTFDNLYLLLKRRGVQVSSLCEKDLHTKGVIETLSQSTADSLFLVNPNNPTGYVLSQTQFHEIVDHCVSNKKILLLDNTFRFFVKPEFDMYQILVDSKVSFISIEDTGKVWPTQDMKASLLIYSMDLAHITELIYEEVYLCISNFSLAVLTHFLVDSKNRGLEDAVWKDVRNRRTLFRSAIHGSALSIHPDSINTELSVEWVQINSLFRNDFAIMNYFKEKNLVLLPGRNFYWSGAHTETRTRNIRFSLLKPMKHFLAAVSALNFGLSEAESQFKNNTLSRRA